MTRYLPWVPCSSAGKPDIEGCMYFTVRMSASGPKCVTTPRGQTTYVATAGLVPSERKRGQEGCPRAGGGHGERRAIGRGWNGRPREPENGPRRHGEQADAERNVGDEQVAVHALDRRIVAPGRAVALEARALRRADEAERREPGASHDRHASHEIERGGDRAARLERGEGFRRQAERN